MKCVIRATELAFALSLSFSAAVAQDLPAADGDAEFAGTVVYTETVKFDIDLPPRMEQYRERMNDTRTASVVLIFNESASLSQPAPEAEPEEAQVAPNDRRNRRFRMFGQRENNATFVDFENEVAVQRREFLDRAFLVEGAPKPAWRMTTDVSEFLGFQSYRATAMVEDTVLVEAWFTTEIPVPAGPDDFYGLPGLILVLTTDGGNRSYVATEVSLRPVDPKIIAAPTEGRKVTREEFDKIVAEKRKEQRATRQGTGRDRRRQ